MHYVLGWRDDDLGPKEHFQGMLSDSRRSHAALLATMAPEGNLDAPLASQESFPHLLENIVYHLLDEATGDGGAISLAEYRAKLNIIHISEAGQTK